MTENPSPRASKLGGDGYRGCVPMALRLGGAENGRKHEEEKSNGCLFIETMALGLGEETNAEDEELEGYKETGAEVPREGIQVEKKTN